MSLPSTTDLPFLPPPNLAPDSLGLICELPFPPSVNRIWRIGRSPAGKRIIYLDKKCRAWRMEAGKMLFGKLGKKISGPFYAFITLDESQRRKTSDVDNRVKVVLDALQRFDLIQNDKFAESVTVSWGRAPTGCSVVVYPASKGAA